jgi:hypothetical protein
MPTTTIELKYPITVNGEDIRGLTVRSPKVRDILAAEKAVKQDGPERAVYLLALTCDVAPAVIEELEAVDFKRMDAAMNGFFV